jgi:hypothetical protein
LVLGASSRSSPSFPVAVGGHLPELRGHLDAYVESDNAADLLLAKEVAAPARPAAAQVRSNAGCSVDDRESPCVTFVTGT